MHKGSLIISVLIFSTLAWAQDSKIDNRIYDGNKAVEKENYIAAEKSYREALSLAPEKTTALFNLGNTHFQDEKYDEASQRFFQAQKVASSKDEKHRAFHNLGNVFMKEKQYQKAVEAYKNALRNNPNDEETRYNYALAKELLDNEEPPQEQEQDDNKDKKDQQDQQDQNEDQKDQEGDQDQKDNKDQEQKGDEGDQEKDEGESKEGDEPKDEEKDQNQNPNPNDQQQKDQPQAPRQGQLSPQQIQSLLEAMNNQEKSVQDKVNAKQIQGVKTRGKKDW